MAPLHVLILLQILLPHIAWVNARPIVSLGTPVSINRTLDTAADGSSAFHDLKLMVSEPVLIQATTTQTSTTQSTPMDAGSGDPFENIPNERDLSPSSSGTDESSTALLVLCGILSIGCLGGMLQVCLWCLNKRRKGNGGIGSRRGCNKSCGVIGCLSLQSLVKTNQESKCLASGKMEASQSISTLTCLPHQENDMAIGNLQTPAATWQPNRDKSYEIELYSPSVYSDARTSLSRSHSNVSDSAWTDCSVTDLSTTYASIYTSNEPLPMQPFLTTTSRTSKTPDSGGFVGQRVKQFNQRASKLSLKPIHVPWLQPEILSPKETTKTLQHRVGSTKLG